MKNWIRIIATFIMTISIIAIAVSCGGGASDIDGRNNDASNDSSFNNEPVDLVLKDYSYKVSTDMLNMQSLLKTRMKDLWLDLLM